MAPPLFFFSYAHADRPNCDGRTREDGSRSNFIDDLFEDLTKRVAALVARPRGEVGFRDRECLAIGDAWSSELAQNLGSASVLVSLITPNLLADPNDSCGREYKVFLDRHELLGADAGPQRIIPIFWENLDHCWKLATPKAKEVLKRTQYAQANLPRGYPQLGLLRIYRTQAPKDYETFIFAISDRIVELALDQPELPR